MSQAQPRYCPDYWMSDRHRVEDCHACKLLASHKASEVKYKRSIKQGKIAIKNNKLPKEWIRLFLSVADLVDGVPPNTILPIIKADWHEIFVTKLGVKIYSDAIAQRSKELLGD